MKVTITVELNETATTRYTDFFKEVQSPTNPTPAKDFENAVFDYMTNVVDLRDHTFEQVRAAISVKAQVEP
jgi:hypothetical protein